MKRMPDTLFHKHADQQGIPFRTLEQVRDTLVIAKQTDADKAMARIMVRFGRLTDEARAWLEQEYPQDEAPPYMSGHYIQTRFNPD